MPCSASSSCCGSLVRSCSKTSLLSYVRMKASSLSPMCRSISTRLFVTAERLPLLVRDVSIRMPSDIGPTVDGVRLRTTAGGELSAHTDGAGWADGGGGCETRGFVAAGLRRAEVAGGVALATVAG